MARIEKTVFISYRRTDVYTALAVYENLKNQAYDVFFDYRSISSGDFEQIITSNIRARAHFLLILTPTALDRCNEPGDWLRREIEFAIDERRNIIPLFFRGFRFGDPSLTEKLTGKLRNISRYNGLNVHEDYFDEAMHRLRSQYLNKPLNTVLHPVSTDIQKVVRDEQVAADRALQQIENVQALFRQVDDEQVLPSDMPVTPQKSNMGNSGQQSVGPTSRGISSLAKSPKTSKFAAFVEKARKYIANATLNLRLAGGFAGIVILFAFLVWSVTWNNFQNPLISPFGRTTELVTQTFQVLVSNTPSPIKTSIAPTTTLTVQPTNTKVTTATLTLTSNALSVGSSEIGKDGMTLLYVPAGEFTMGDNNSLTEGNKPEHVVQIDSFWIDRTEITNYMYSLCVQAGKCQEPKNKSSQLNPNYYGNDEFNDYPVIFVNWDMGRSYCEWAGRRLPTEAEWEKAARGWDGREYPWGTGFPYGEYTDFLNNNNRVGDTSEVGRYPKGASPYGARDMSGNVWEWVADWYSFNYYSKSPKSNPLGPDTGQNRVVRGGSWASYSPSDQTYQTQAYYRYWYAPSTAAAYVGFRCAMDATP